MNSIDSPLQFIPAMFDRLTDIDWAHHRTQLTISAGIFIGYLLSILMLLGMGILAIGRAFTYLRRQLPDWLRAIATQLDRLNTWLEDDQQPAVPAAPEPAAIVTTANIPATGTPQNSTSRAPRRNRRRRHTPTATA